MDLEVLPLEPLSFVHPLAPLPSAAIPRYLAGQSSFPIPAQSSCVPVGAGTGPVCCTCPGLSARCCHTCWKAGSSRRSLTEGFRSHAACLLARCPQPLLAVLCAINRFPCRTRRTCCPTALWVLVLWSLVLRDSGAAASCPLTRVGLFSCPFSVQ